MNTIGLMAINLDQALAMLRQLNEESWQFGLRMNLAETKDMNKRDDDRDIKFETSSLKDLIEYILATS